MLALYTLYIDILTNFQGQPNVIKYGSHYFLPEHHFSNDELEQQQQQRWHFHLHEANGPGENKAVLRKPGGMEIMLECLNEIMGILRVYRDALTTYHPKSKFIHQHLQP